MRFHQRGATFIGMVVIIAILGFGLYAVIRLTPVYFEYMEVVRAMEQTAKEADRDSTSPQSLRAALERRWSIEDIKSVQPNEIDIKKEGDGYAMRAWYRTQVPFVANVSLVAEFDKTVDVKR